MLERHRVVGATVYGSCKVGSDPGTEKGGCWPMMLTGEMCWDLLRV